METMASNIWGSYWLPAARQRFQRLVDNDVLQIVAITNPLSLSKRRMAMIGVKATGSVRTVASCRAISVSLAKFICWNWSMNRTSRLRVF